MLTEAALGRSTRTLGEVAAKAADAAAPLRPLAAIGDVLGPAGGALDGINAVVGDPSLDGGWEVADRGISAVSAAAAAYPVLAAVGVVSAMTPAGWVAVGAISAASAAWSIGKWGYQNREDIAEFMVDRWDDASEFAEGVGKGASDTIGDALGNVRDAGRAVGNRLEEIGGWLRR